MSDDDTSFADAGSTSPSSRHPDAPTDAEFRRRRQMLTTFTCREDYEQALFDLYDSCSADQGRSLREAYRRNELPPPKEWRNPLDYGRSDLTSEQKAVRLVLQISLTGAADSDYRDVLTTLASSYHNLLLRGVDADAFFESVAAKSDAEVAELIRGFVARSAKDKSLDAFHLRVEQTPESPVAVPFEKKLDFTQSGDPRDMRRTVWIFFVLLLFACLLCFWISAQLPRWLGKP